MARRYETHEIGDRLEGSIISLDIAIAHLKARGGEFLEVYHYVKVAEINIAAIARLCVAQQGGKCGRYLNVFKGVESQLDSISDSMAVQMLGGSMELKRSILEKDHSIHLKNLRDSLKETYKEMKHEMAI